MSTTRDDFPLPTKRLIAHRAGHRCSNPSCRRSTAGPAIEPTRTVNLGVAAHITAAAPGGPRFNGKLSTDERKSASNAIWLCQNCAKLIDSDPSRYTISLLLTWKDKAESLARSEIESIEQPIAFTQDLTALDLPQEPPLILTETQEQKLHPDYLLAQLILLVPRNAAIPAPGSTSRLWRLISEGKYRSLLILTDQYLYVANKLPDWAKDDFARHLAWLQITHALAAAKTGRLQTARTFAAAALSNRLHHAELRAWSFYVLAIVAGKLEHAQENYYTDEAIRTAQRAGLHWLAIYIRIQHLNKETWRAAERGFPNPPTPSLKTVLGTI